MKKIARKLTLSRETLRTLADSQLKAADGAATLQISCDTETWRVCPSINRCPTESC